MIHRLTIPRTTQLAMLLLIASRPSGAVAGETVAPPADSATPAVLSHLPADALGFVLVHDLADADAKTRRLLTMFDAQGPAPLDLVRFATGLGDGLDAAGDLLLAFLPVSPEQPALIPLVLAPVADYAVFVEAVGGDASGEICRVTLGGEDVLIAQKGAFAVMMNVEHRATMESLLAAEPAAPASVAPLAAWLAGNQVSAVLMPAGAELLLTMGEQGLAAGRAEIEENFADEQFAQQLAEARQGLAMADMMLGGVRDEVRGFAVGLSVDETMNLRLGARMVLSPESQIATLAELKLAGRPLLGYSEQPFVGVAAGVMPPELMAWSMSLYQRLIASAPEDFGYGEMSDEQWQQFAEAQALAYEGLNSYSMIMLPGEEADPILSHYYGVFQVEDSAKMLDNWEKAFESTNRLMAEFQTEIDIEYLVERRTIAGKAALEISVDLAKAMQDQNVPAMDALVKALIGDDGKMRYHVAALNEHVVVAGLAPEGRLADLMAAVAQNENGLADSSSVQTTLALLDARAPWQGLLSPSGCVAWFDRVITKFFQNLGGFVTPPEIPEFPATSPIGVAVQIVDGQLAADLAVPSDTLQGLADYVEKVKQIGEN